MSIWLDGGNDTIDRGFLLSVEETVRYFGDSGLLSNRPGDEWVISDAYNEARSSRNLYGSVAGWWLRTPGISPVHAVVVDIPGTIFVYGSIVVDMGGQALGVRPAMWLYLN